MTDLSPPSGSAGTPFPAPTFFDPSFERIPQAAAWTAGSSGPVLLLFDPAAHREWVADAAIALATEWTRSGRRTVLADLSLEDPVLHERIGMTNQDGIVDIFLYGASLARSARPVPGRGFYLISAGTYTTESEDVFRHPRWEKIVAGFREAQASLLLFVPADARGLASLSRWAGEAMLLGGPRSEGRFRAAAWGLTVQAWLAPPGSEGGSDASFGAVPAPHPHPADPADRFPDPEPAPANWTEVAGALRRTPEEFRSAEEIVGAPPATLPVPDPAWETEKPAPARRGASPVMLGLLALLLLVLAGVLLYTLRPDLLGLAPRTGAEADAGLPKAPAAPPRAAAAPQPAGTALPYAVNVSNFPELRAALREVERQQGRFPEAQFYVVPEDVQGVLYYKVMAGMVSDTTEAAELRRRLVEAGVITRDQVDDEGWALIQSRPLAFSMGEFPSDSAARAVADSLTTSGLPAYTVAVPYSDGGERWRVYGGAFRDSTTAEPMRRLLQDNRVRAPLVDRTGRAPAAPK